MFNVFKTLTDLWNTLAEILAEIHAEADFEQQFTGEQMLLAFELCLLFDRCELCLKESKKRIVIMRSTLQIPFAKDGQAVGTISVQHKIDFSFKVYSLELIRCKGRRLKY